MTDKEQIIIDDMEVLVQSCKFGQEGHCDCYSCTDRYPHCLDFPNCYFKQPQRKKQECEELKKRATIAEDNFACEIQARLYHQNEWLKFSEVNDRYRKALEEIEVTIAALHFRTLPFQQGITHELADRVQYYKNIIRDIISKARGKNDN